MKKMPCTLRVNYGFYGSYWMNDWFRSILVAKIEVLISILIFLSPKISTVYRPNWKVRQRRAVRCRGHRCLMTTTSGSGIGLSTPWRHMACDGEGWWCPLRHRLPPSNWCRWSLPNCRLMPLPVPVHHSNTWQRQMSANMNFICIWKPHRLSQPPVSWHGGPPTKPCICMCWLLPMDPWPNRWHLLPASVGLYSWRL